MRAALEVAVSFARLLEWKHAIDHGARTVEVHRTVHILEHLARAHEYSLQRDRLAQHRHWIYLASSRENTDQAYTPAHPDRPQRLPERSRSADFDHMVDAGAAGQFEHALMPVRRSFVIDHIGGAEFSQPFELAIAARSRDHPCAVHARKLDCEDRYAAGAHREHRLARFEFSFRHERVPRSNTRAWQRRRLFVAHVVGNMNEPALVQRNVFCEHPVNRAAERRTPNRVVRPSGDP